MSPSPSLSDRALAVLVEGPQSTAELAAHFGLQGDPALAARTIWGLLGDDPRFAVDGRGVWSVRIPAAVPLRPLRDESWVIVDVETTGGSPAAGHRVTEVAAVVVSGGEIRDTWSTLVHPERPIPYGITMLTGISDRMVAGAPRFAEVVPALSRVLEGHIFVAHNAAFDWRFLSAEMERAAGTLRADRQLCTVRLARKLLPQIPSRSLDGLASWFGLEIPSRHRALDDAVATARVLLHFIAMLEEREISDWVAMDVLLSARRSRRKRSAMPRSMERP